MFVENFKILFFYKMMYWNMSNFYIINLLQWSPNRYKAHTYIYELKIFNIYESNSFIYAVIICINGFIKGDFAFHKFSYNFHIKIVMIVREMDNNS